MEYIRERREQKKGGGAQHVTDEHESEDEVSNLLGSLPAAEKEKKGKSS